MSILRPTKRELSEMAAAVEFEHGIPFGWRRLICRGCGADYCTSSGPLVFDPCGNCGTFVGNVMKATVRYAAA